MSIYDTLNPMQREAVFFDKGPLLILAGAGSGKTRVLTHRIAYLIEEESVHPYNILAITFTNKAAREMKERVNKMIGEERGQKVLACTFHSFCALMLRKHGKHIDLSPHFTVLSPGDDEDIIAIVKSDKNKRHSADKSYITLIYIHL